MKLSQIDQGFSQLSSTAFCPFLAKPGKTSYQIIIFKSCVFNKKL